MTLLKANIILAFVVTGAAARPELCRRAAGRAQGLPAAVDVLPHDAAEWKPG